MSELVHENNGNSKPRLCTNPTIVMIVMRIMVLFSASSLAGLRILSTTYYCLSCKSENKKVLSMVFGKLDSFVVGKVSLVAGIGQNVMELFVGKNPFCKTVGGKPRQPIKCLVAWLAKISHGHEETTSSTHLDFRRAPILGRCT